MSGIDQMRFRAPQSPNSVDIPSAFPGPKFASVTEEDCDRILKLIRETEQDEENDKAKENKKDNKRKKNEKKDEAKKVEMKLVDKQPPLVDNEPEEHVTSLNMYQPKLANKPKVIRKQLPITAHSPYFSGNSNKQEEAKPEVVNSINNKRRIFQALYGKDKPYKKHKVFSDDGFIIVKDTIVELRDDSKKYIGKVEIWDSQFPKTYDNTTRFVCAGYLVEFSEEITEAEYAKM